MANLRPGWKIWGGTGVGILVFLGEKMSWTLFAMIPIAAVALGLIGVGLWQWVGRFQYATGKSPHARQELQKLQSMVVLLAIATGVISFLFLTRIVPDSDAEATLQRYRQMLGLSDIPNKTAYTEMSNRELKKLGTKVYRDLYELQTFYNGRVTVLKERLDKKEIDQAKFVELHKAQTKKTADEWGLKLRVDASMVRKELRNRIPNAARKHVVGLPDPTLKPDDPRHGGVSLIAAMTNEFAFLMAESWAREIEELVKLLPE